MLNLPKIDDRSYQDILKEALERVPIHNPEWKNLLPSDPGVTILQLFAFMNENLLYRANQIPERNRLKFLNLLGITRQAASSAKTLVAFSNTKGPLKSITVPGDLELFAGKIPFRTSGGLDILPVEGRAYYKKRYDTVKLQALQESTPELFYGDDNNPQVTPGYYETTPLPQPTTNAALPSFDLPNDAVDSALWIALLARSKEAIDDTREAIATKTLSLGIVPSIDENTKVLQPGGPLSDENQVSLQYAIPNPPENGEFAANASRVPEYTTITPRASANVLQEPGIVELKIPEKEKLLLWRNLEPEEAGHGAFPPLIDDEQLAERIVTWIRIRVPGITSDANVPSYLNVKLAWAGINAAQAVQEARVAVEDLGTGNGEPDQTYFLSNTPVIIDPPEKTQLSINGVIWTRVDDLYTAMEEVEEMAKVKSQDSQATSRVYTLDRASGQVKFGDGRWGARPPLGAKIQARYSYGGGNSGNVAIDVINKGAALPPGVKVRNPIKASGGADSESVADAERRIPSFLKHRNRLVTAPDFKDIAERTPGVEMGRVDVLPLFNPELPKVLSAGVVTLMVIPQNDPLHPEAPQPDQEFLTNVCDYLDPRRLVTTEVYVRGPKYKDIFITIGLEVVPGEQFAPVRETVIAQIKKFLSPLEGGREGTGWPRDRALVAAELLAEVTRVKGVAFVNQAYISDSVGATMESIAFSGLYLPRIAHIGVRLGDADLPGTGYTDTGDDESGTTLTTINPIPLIPETC